MDEEPIIKKAYYSIGEVGELADLKPHVLRYWETQFEALRPGKNSAGNRVYRPKEVKLVLLVKHLLYEEKYTIEGAKRRIRTMRRTGSRETKASDGPGPESLLGLRDGLEQLRKTLTLPPEFETE